MTEEQNSAEKELLRLIENPAEVALPKPAPAKGTPAIKVKRKPKPGLDLRELFSSKNLKDRKTILILLFGATTFIFLIFITTIISEFQKSSNPKNFEKFTYIVEGQEVDSKDAKAETPAEEEKKSILRNIFKPFVKKKEEPLTEVQTVQAGLKEYKLVGISLDAVGGANSYAMIENTKTNITLFLKKGDSLDGMQLKDIFEDRLVFVNKGQTIELR